MDSIVLELQREAVASDTNVTNLLRKSLVIARKLKIRDFENWVSKELNGYMDTLKEETPYYRKITGSLQFFNPLYGWRPVIIENIKFDELVRVAKLAQSIPDLEFLMNSESNNLSAEVSPVVRNELNKNTGIPTEYKLDYSKNQIQNIIEKVRNIILEWSLQLEEDGILGEGISFSKKEKEEADKQNYSVNNFHGNVSGLQLQQHTQHSTQTQVNELDIEKVSEFISDLQKHLSLTGLSEDNQRAIETEIETISKQLSKTKPKTRIVKESMKTIRSLLEGVAGNFIAQALLSQIGLFM